MALTPKSLKQLSKFLAYALGRRPDEFGLIPDKEGYFKIKTVLQALHEDRQWRQVRQADLNTLIISIQPASIEMADNLVRAKDRDHIPKIDIPEQLPKLVYTSVRQRAYPRVHDNGVQSAVPAGIIMSSELDMARRLGARIDNDPVLLTVNTDQAIEAGCLVRQFGETLFLTDSLPVGVFSGPPLPKEKQAPQDPKKPVPPVKPKTPGSYFPDFGTDTDPGGHEGNRARQDERKWKKDRRQARREKTRRQNS